MSLLGAIAATLLTLGALSAGMARNSANLDGGAIVFLGILIVLGISPYLVTAKLATATGPFVRLWAAWAAIAYSVVDFIVRGQAVFFSASSTDAIALFTMPIVGAPVVFGVCALGAKLWTAFARQGQ